MKKKTANLIMVLIIAVIAIAGVTAAFLLKTNTGSGLGSQYKITKLKDNTLIEEGQTDTCTITIVCDTILNNTDNLNEEKAPFVPKNGTILPKTTVSFAQLDPIAASDFLNTVRKINMELGTTVIITEHRLEDIFPYADRAVVMDKGRVIADDTPGKVGQLLFEENNPMFAAMPTPVRVYYGAGGNGESPLTVRQGRSWLSKEFPKEPSIKAIPAPALPEEIENPALTLKELWFRYEKDSPDILRGVSAEVPAGSLYAILGGNGAGKSTTLKAISGVCRPYRGKVTLFGKPVEKYKSSELFHGCLAMLPQDPKSLFVKKTVREDLTEMTKDKQEIDRIAALCQVTELLDSHPYDLSGGEQQRAALAKVLLTNPRLLLLDEPTKGIDSFFKETFAEILADLKKQGITIVMVSHDVEFCARYADIVSMFFDGQVLTTDTPRRFFGANSFYTTAAHRMSRHVFEGAVTAEDVIRLYKENKEAAK